MASSVENPIAKRVYPHLLRHSIATILLDSGLVPIDQVQKFLGHLQLSTTRDDTLLGPDKQIGAANRTAVWGVAEGVADGGWLLRRRMNYAVTLIQHGSLGWPPSFTFERAA